MDQEWEKVYLIFFHNKGIIQRNFIYLIFKLVSLFKRRQNAETGHVTREVGGAELTLFNNRPVTSQTSFSLGKYNLYQPPVFQVILRYRVCKWRRSNVSYAETEKAARGACQVCLISDFFCSKTVHFLTQCSSAEIMMMSQQILSRC